MQRLLADWIWIPNLAFARTWRGWIHVYLGEGDSAIWSNSKSPWRLSPLDVDAHL